ncbi:serine arginine-rich splicing factor, partial [Mortierella sp. AD031]
MPTRVYLGHLPREASDRDIERLFKNYGLIREVTLKNGFGFVDFDDSRDADDVVHDFHGRDFLGERLVVEIARGERRRDDRRDDRFGPPERTEYRMMVDNLAHGVSWQ